MILHQQSIRHSLNRANDYYAFRVKGEPLPTQADSPRPSVKLPSHELEQRVALMERKLDALYDLVKSLASDQKFKNQLQSNNVVERINEIESVSIVDTHHYDIGIQRYLQAQADALYTVYSKPQTITDEDDAGKLRQICNAFTSIKSLEISELRLGRKKLPEHVLLSDKHGKRCICFLHSESFQSVNSRLMNLNHLVTQNSSISFILIRDQQLRNITSQKASIQLDRFKNARMQPGRRTHYEHLNLKRRVEFELAFKLITDIINRDFEMTMAEGLSAFIKINPDNWIVKLLARAETPARKAN